MSRVDLRSLPHAQAAELAASFEAQNWTIVHDDACEGDTLLVLPSLAWDDIASKHRELLAHHTPATILSRFYVAHVDLVRQNAHRLDAFVAHYRRRLRGVDVSTTQVPFKSMCQWLTLSLGGSYQGDYTQNVTHLLSCSATETEKTKAALKLRRPVLLPDWLLACAVMFDESDGNLEVPDAWANRPDEKSPQFSVNRLLSLPPLHGMRITVTGFDLESREQLQQLIQRAGGEYLPSLAQNVTTHLIALNASGQKYDYARQWNIPVLHRDWIQAQIDSEGKIRQSDFDISTYRITPHTSALTTPRVDLSALEHEAELDASKNDSIACSFPRQPQAPSSKATPKSIEDERTVELPASGLVSMKHATRTAAEQFQEFDVPALRSLLEQRQRDRALNQSNSAAEFGGFQNYLSDCNVFLSGFDDNQSIRKILMLLSLGNGTRAQQFQVGNSTLNATLGTITATHGTARTEPPLLQYTIIPQSTSSSHEKITHWIVPGAAHVHLTSSTLQLPLSVLMATKCRIVSVGWLWASVASEMRAEEEPFLIDVASVPESKPASSDFSALFASDSFQQHTRSASTTSPTAMSRPAPSKSPMAMQLDSTQSSKKQSKSSASKVKKSESIALSRSASLNLQPSQLFRDLTFLICPFHVVADSVVSSSVATPSMSNTQLTNESVVDKLRYNGASIVWTSIEDYLAQVCGQTDRRDNSTTSESQKSHNSSAAIQVIVASTVAEAESAAHRLGTAAAQASFVSPAWVQACCDAQTLLHVNLSCLFVPSPRRMLDVSDESERIKFQQLVVSTTVYDKNERAMLMHWIEALAGGKYTPNLKNRVNTHVLAKFESGDKVSKARQWNIPVCTSAWLYACLCSGKLLEPGTYSPPAETEPVLLWQPGCGNLRYQSEEPASDQSKEVSDDVDMPDANIEAAVSEASHVEPSTSPVERMSKSNERRSSPECERALPSPANVELDAPAAADQESAPFVSSSSSAESYCVAITGCGATRKAAIVEQILSLGGCVSAALGGVDDDHELQAARACTHVVAVELKRSETMFLALLLRTPVLQISFVEQSVSAGKFCNPSSHLWTSTQPYDDSLTSQLLRSLSYWHNTANKMPFEGWKVLLCVDTPKTRTFVRVLNVGGAEFVVYAPTEAPSKAQLTALKKQAASKIFTHALFDTTLFEESTPAWLNGIATTWKDHISSAGVQMFRSEFVMDLIVHCNALESNSYAIFSENDAETPAKRRKR